MQSARHRSVKNAIRYRRDASYLLNVARTRAQNLMNVTPEWNLVFCADVHLARSLHETKSFNLLNFIPKFSQRISLIDIADEILKVKEVPMSSEIERLLSKFCEFDVMSGQRMKLFVEILLAKSTLAE